MENRFRSKRLQGLTPYRLVTPESFARESEGISVRKIDWNEGFFDGYVNDGYSRYENPNMSERQVIVQEIFKEYGELEPRLYPGSDIAHIELLRSFADVDDKMLIFGPTYDNFRVTAESFGVKITYCQLDDWTLENMSTAIQGACPKLVYICNPNNPTGNYIYNLEELVSDFPETLFFIDEAYIDFVGNLRGVKACFDNVVYFRTFSKAFSLAAIRLGVVFASPKLMECIDILYNPKHCSKFALDSMREVLQMRDQIDVYIEQTIYTRNELVRSINAINRDVVEAQPSFGNFVFVKVRSTHLVASLMAEFEKKNIFVRKFIEFHGLTGVRISIINDVETIKELVDTFHNLCSDAK